MIIICRAHWKRSGDRDPENVIHFSMLKTNPNIVVNVKTC